MPPLRVLALVACFLAGCSRPSDTPDSKPAPSAASRWLSDIVQVAAHEWETCARDSKGRVYCWGRALGCSGDCERAQPVRVPVDDVVDLSMGGMACVLQRSGDVHCWGPVIHLSKAGMAPPWKAPRKLMNVPGATQVVASMHGACAAGADGNFVCGYAGENASAAPFPAKPEGRRATSGVRGALCGAHDSVVSCWDPYSGADVKITFAGPAFEGAKAGASLGLANTAFCYAQPSGTLFCAGNNRVAALADGTKEERAGFHQVQGLTDVKEVVLQNMHRCVRTGAGDVHCWGADRRAEHGKAEMLTRPRKVEGLAPATSLIAGASHNCVLHADGTVSCWGGCGAGACGNPGERAPGQPLRVLAPAP